MKAAKKDTIKIINKMNEWSMDYQEGEIFTVESTWYGGVNVTSKTGVPLSLDEVEYEVIGKEEQTAVKEKRRVIFHTNAVCQIEKMMASIEKLLEKQPSGQCYEIEVLAEQEAVEAFFQTEDRGRKVSALQGNGVRFTVCKDSLKALEAEETRLLPNIKTVELGIAWLIEKQAEGFLYIKI